jgi:hypothetical protein
MTRLPLGFSKTFHCQKRPTTVSKETYYSVTRDLCKIGCVRNAERTVSKETYYSVKRDLLHKRPMQDRLRTKCHGQVIAIIYFIIAIIYLRTKFLMGDDQVISINLYLLLLLFICVRSS